MTHRKKDFQLPVTKVYVCEHGERSRLDWINCEIGRDIDFSTAGLESYCLSNWEPITFDALLLTSVVDFCDRVARRPALGWGRQFEIKIPVHEPDRWSDKVMAKLTEVLSFVTGDRWHIQLRARKSPSRPPRQGNFEIPDPSSAVLPFSDGLDSRITALLLEYQQKVKLIRVRLGSGNGQSKQESLVKQPFAVVPYKVNSSRHRFYESSARSRGFKFSMLSGIAAYLSKASEIYIPESGQGALGPALVVVGHGYEDYRNDPRFTARMATFLKVLFDHSVRFSFPRIWYTKGETLKAYVDLAGDTWSDTRSCWQQSRQVSVNGQWRQCGVCAACMLRRLSVHAAGFTDRPETYVWESLSAGTFEEGAAVGFTKITTALREYAIAGTMHLDHLASLPKSPLHSVSIRRAATQIAAPLGLEPCDAEARLNCLLSRHSLEWGHFIESLGSNSFVAKWIAREI